MAEETHYTASTGIVTISTANPNLSPTGTVGTVLTGAGNGTYIKTVKIKAQGDTTRGMVRLWIYKGPKYRLLQEVDVYAVTQTGDTPTFEATIPLNFFLASGYELRASTENAETFNVIAEGQDVSYYASSVRADTTVYTVQSARKAIQTANSNLDGTGTLGTCFTAEGSGTSSGASIRSITIKSVVNVTSGMVRLFINDGSSNYLFTEVPVKTTTKSALDTSFVRTLSFANDFDLEAGFLLKASTENASGFSVSTEVLEYSYVA